MQSTNHPPQRAPIYPLPVFAEQPECPYSAGQLRRLIAEAQPVIDTSGNVVSPGDPLLLAAVIQPGGKGGHLFIDAQQFAVWLDAHRLTPLREAS